MCRRLGGPYVIAPCVLPGARNGSGARLRARTNGQGARNCVLAIGERFPAEAKAAPRACVRI